jgi:hypothetical protein
VRIVGEQFFPPRGRDFPSRDLPKPLLNLLRFHKLDRGTRSHRIDLLDTLKRVGLMQVKRTEEQARPARKKTARSAKWAGPYDRKVPIRSAAGLLDLRHTIIDFLIETFGARPFIPVSKKGRDLWITLGWTEPTFIRLWVGVVDSDGRDVSDWNQRRITNHEGTYTAVLAKEFHRLTRDRARRIRIWLPALGLAVLFTPGGIDTEIRAAAIRGRNRELKCFALEALWGALGCD